MCALFIFVLFVYLMLGWNRVLLYNQNRTYLMITLRYLDIAKFYPKFQVNKQDTF